MISSSLLLQTVELKSTVTMLIVAAYLEDVQFKKARPPSDITLKRVSGTKIRNAVVSTTYTQLYVNALDSYYK